MESAAHVAQRRLSAKRGNMPNDLDIVEDALGYIEDYTDLEKGITRLEAICTAILKLRKAYEQQRANLIKLKENIAHNRALDRGGI